MKKFFNQKVSGKKATIFIIVFIAVLAAITYLSFSDQPEELEYTEFLQMVENEQIEEINLRGNSETMHVYDKDEVKYVTENPRTLTFKEEMLIEGVSVVNKAPFINKFGTIMMLIFQLGIFVLIGVLVVYFMRTTMQKKTKIAGEKSNVTFASVSGNMEAKADMEFMVNFLKDPKKYKDIGAKLPKGVVLYGPPGTGKTLMARAVAGEAGVPFYYASGSDFVEMYVGVGARRVRDLFKQAKENSPSIVFIDEIDAVGTKRSTDASNSEKDQTINALLSELDGFESDQEIIVMVATNRLEDLDHALIRPGRFDRHVNIGLPDFKDRKAILKNYSKGKKLAEDLSFDSIANITIGFSGASLEALMNEAAIIAVNRGSEVITYEDIDESYFKIAMKGSKKLTKNENKEEVELVAYHEAGHALVTKLLTTNHIHKVTIIPSTSGAGGAVFSVPERSSLISKKDLMNNIKVLYAGRAGEEILKGNDEEITSGASQDIKQATIYIKALFSELGMSDKFGMMAVNNEDLYMDEAVELSKKLYDETLQLLKDNKDKLDVLASVLLDRETLTGKELDEILDVIERGMLPG